MSALDASAPTSGVDQLLGSSAALAAWVALAWLGITVFLEVASALPGAAGRGCAAVAARTSPMLVRRIVQAAIGVSVLAGPMTAGSAFATGPSTTHIDIDTGRPARLRSCTNPGRRQPCAGHQLCTAESRSTRNGLRRVVATSCEADARPVRSHSSRASLTATQVTRIVAATDGYVVRRGDTLWDIAARHLGPTASAVDISRAWPAWYAANRAVIGPDPSVIRPGELLSPPSVSTAPASTR